MTHLHEAPPTKHVQQFEVIYTLDASDWWRSDNTVMDDLFVQRKKAPKKHFDSSVLSHLLLVPPSILQPDVQPVGCCCPLRRQATDAALHEAERLFSCSHLVQKDREVGSEGSLGRREREGVNEKGQN